MEEEIRRLQDKLAAQTEEICRLRARLAAYETRPPATLTAAEEVKALPPLPTETKLTNVDIQKYARQIILPEFRVGGQLSLKVPTVQ